MMKILIIGHSGTGKSSSINTLPRESTAIINVANKPLPFKNANFRIYNVSKNNTYNDVIRIFDEVNKDKTIENLIIDDAQYIMAFEFMNRAKERNYDKFVDIGQNMFNVVTYPLREDLFTVFLWHAEELQTNNGTLTKAKTIGKMLDDKITLEGLFTVVLKTEILKNNKKVEYVFQTNSTGDTICKSPMGMFPDLYIPNDLNYVKNAIIQYYKS